MAEDVREEELRELRPRHAPGADEVEAERAGARGIVDVVDRGKDLRRPDQEAGDRDPSDPPDASDRFHDLPRRVPGAIERVHAEQKTGLHYRSRLSDETLDAEEE